MEILNPVAQIESQDSLITEKYNAVRLQRERIYGYDSALTKNILLQGKELHLIKADFDNISYTEEYLEGIYGFITYESYRAGSKKDSGLDMAKSSADTYMKIYRTFVLELGYTIDEPLLCSIAYSKLNRIVKYVNEENAEELLDLCLYNSRADLITELSQLQPLPEIGEVAPEVPPFNPSTRPTLLIENVRRLPSRNAKAVLEGTVQTLEELITAHAEEPLEKLKAYITASLELD